MLILGGELAAYLKARRTENKQPCLPGEIYCVRCRAPKKPAGAMADYQPVTATLGNLMGICPDCESMILKTAVEMRQNGQLVQSKNGCKH